MTNTEDFEGEAELDAEFGAEEGLDAPGADGDFGAEDGAAAPPPAKKSGGAGKFLVLLLLLVLGGGAGAVKLELVELPFDIPGLTPDKSAARVAAATPDGSSIPSMPALQMNMLEDEPPEVVADDPATSTGAMPSAIGDQEEVGLSIKPPGVSAGEGLDAFGLPMEDTAATAVADPFGLPEDMPSAASDPFAGMGEPSADEMDKAIDLSAKDADPFADTMPVGDDPLGLAAGDDPFAEAPAMQELSDAPAMQAVPVGKVEKAEVDPVPVKAVDDAKASETIAALEKKVTTLEKDLKAANDRAIKAEEQAARDKDALQKAIARAEKAEKKSASASSSSSSSPSSTKAVSASSTPKAAAPVKSAPAPRWVLKSAKPGVAWVSLPGSVALKTVAVGDTLAGIGKVKAVAKDASGRWVVSGTQGSISQ